ncbi:MAG: IS200/IS605 family transposase [Candidatus Cloacimonetes bacterium]|nr:IS200/IS605 family transposase [Candidatus Cloacimonadota bacterium]
MSTYSQLYIHVVFSVKNRDPLLSKSWRDRLYQYIVPIIEKRKNKVYAISGTDDHIHIFFSMSPSQSISSLMLEVKRDTSIWIKKNMFVKCRFEWQEGYGAFSYSKTHIDNVVKYIHNQDNFHKNKSSLGEYKEILEKYEADFKDEYVT